MNGPFQFTPLENALKQLEAATASAPANDLERDGTIQRFEYCFELSWKTLRSLLLKAGRSEVSGSPRPLFRDALQEGFIENFQTWDEFLQARNESTHTYQLRTAQEVHRIACLFPPHAKALLQKMKEFAAKMESGT
jgi:nucleotidyltransferase substrate binding protein (TIGR01987 family)